VLKAVYRFPYLFLCTNDARSWGGGATPFTSVRVVRLPIAFFPDIATDAASGFVDRTFGGASTIDDPPGAQLHYGWPAVEANKKHDAVLVYARSGPQIYPEIRYSAYLAAENDIRPSRLLKTGEAAYDYGSGALLRWGDLAGASVDPKDDTGIWITHQYARSAASSNNYALWVGKVFGKRYYNWQLKDFTIQVAEVIAGGTFGFSGQLANGGDGRAGAARGAVELVSLRARRRLGVLNLPALPAGGTVSFQRRARLPRGIAPGDYRVRVRFPYLPAAEYGDDRNTAEAFLRVRRP
jgi:hypothetical protein